MNSLPFGRSLAISGPTYAAPAQLCEKSFSLRVPCLTPSTIVDSDSDTPRHITVAALPIANRFNNLLGRQGVCLLASVLRYPDLAPQQRVQDFNRRYAITAHASRGRNARRTLDCRAWHNLEKSKPGPGQTQISHRPEEPDRHQPRGRSRDLRSDEGRGEVFL